MNEINYLELLQNGYEEYKRYALESCKYMYLSDDIFMFSTDDSEMSSLFGKKATEVIHVINKGLTYEYIKDENNYLWYLMLLNTNFFKDRYEYGVSIRGAWWEYEDIPDLYSCRLFTKEGEQVNSLSFKTRKDWIKFCEALVEFIND